MPSAAYFNTTNAEGRELRDWTDKALTQEARIRVFFDEAPEFLYTPSEIRNRVFGGTTPLTSVRRAMTNLTEQGFLRKTTKKRLGPYGRPEFCWMRRAPASRSVQGSLL